MAGNRVLLIDDEMDLVKITTNALLGAGYEVESAYNGREAIGAFVEALYKKKPFSIMLLDVRLPDINGIEVLQIIRKEEEERGISENNLIPVIVFTAYDKPWMDPLMIKGCNDFMLKSSTDEELLEKVKDILKKGGNL